MDIGTLSSLGIGIIWTLLLLSSTLSISKFYKDDFENNNLLVLHINGFSFEFISILKTFSHFIYVQIPFLISIPVASLLLDLSYDKIYQLLISFIIGSFFILFGLNICIHEFIKSKKLFIRKYNSYGV